MSDVVSREKRSEMMSGIRGKDTSPEMMVRSMLHKAGYRYRLHDSTLPGKPDLVFLKYNAVIFVHGCFWHRHNCNRFKWPGTRPEFWKEKLNANAKRDERHREELINEGFRILTIWECALVGTSRTSPELLGSEVETWLKSTETDLEICGESK
ncbi:MAG: very short patch repair endonuclease [Balneolaceae bacterium]